jgi:catechol 2,3-dioxygenase-like lactoylglutathione lyase family enzyme
LQAITRRNFLLLTGSAVLAPKFASGADSVPARLDHILLGVNDLDRGVTFVESRLGVRPAFGGVHPGRGTRNALLSLGPLHYLEVIAPDPNQPDAEDTRGLKKLAEPRIVGWAAHPGNLDSFAARIHRQGIAASGPEPGSRQRPDGRTLNWKTLTLADDRGGLLPFFIEWGAGTPHPSSDAPAGARLSRFELASPKAEELKHLCAILDLDVSVAEGPAPQIRAEISGTRGATLLLTS